MQLSNAPGKLLLPFANAGAKNSIPVASQIGIVAGAASLTDGFPPLTRTPIAAGGVPPSGLDMNGILYALSAALRWANAGGGYVYDGTFAADANVTGYPKGARILRSDGAGYWLNTIDGNTVDPESVTVNAAQVAGWVPDLTNGIAAITMTSANVTLTPAQYGKPFVVLSGVLTANLNLIFPNLAGEWTVINNCTGAFTVTAKTAAGTGAVVTPGCTRIIWGDGTNIAGAMNEVETPAQFNNSTKLASTAFVRQSGMQTNGIRSLSANTTLTAADVGTSVYLGGAGGFTVTLPLAASLPAGTRIEFISGVAATIARQGAEPIFSGNVTGTEVASMAIGAGDTMTLIASPSIGWFVFGSAQLGFTASFGKSFSGNGYQKLPSGTIIQWGAATFNSSGASVAFPVAFPGAVYSIVLTPNNSSANTMTGVGATTLTSFTGYLSNSVGANWLAIGR